MRVEARSMCMGGMRTRERYRYHMHADTQGARGDQSRGHHLKSLEVRHRIFEGRSATQSQRHVQNIIPRLFIRYQPHFCIRIPVDDLHAVHYLRRLEFQPQISRILQLFRFHRAHKLLWRHGKHLWLRPAPVHYSCVPTARVSRCVSVRVVPLLQKDAKDKGRRRGGETGSSLP